MRDEINVLSDEILCEYETFKYSSFAVRVAYLKLEKINLFKLINHTVKNDQSYN